MGEFSASRAQLIKFHGICFLVGLTLTLGSYWFVLIDSFSLVTSTLNTLKLYAVIVGILNGVGFFVLASAKSIKSKSFSLLTLPLAYLVSILASYTVLVLFGAQLIVKVSETFHLACLLATCSIFPFIAAAQRDWAIWIKLFFFMKSKISPAEWNLLFCAAFPIIGCLAGSVFIPLDWDRPWQRWPITCSIGCMIGFTTAHLFCLLRMSSLLKATKWKFS